MPDLSLSELLRPELAELRPYVPVQGDYSLRLDANEAPPLLGEAARGRLAELAAATAWERYPDATMGELRQAIARRSEVSADEVLAGVGSDEVISLLLTVLSRPRGRLAAATLITTTPTFVMYRMSARIRGLNVLEVPLDASWDLSVAALERAIEMSPPNLIFIASPNNPTGNVMDPGRLEQVIEAAAGALVVIDEAYVDYADRSALDLYRRHSNVALLRTLSKVGFAALRIGWMIARPELVREVDKARLPYNLGSVTQRLGTAVLGELAPEVRALTETVVSERQRLAAALAADERFEVTPSQANFLWLRTRRPAAEVFDALGKRGILVRSFHPRGGRLAHQVRITIGTPEQNDAVLAALREVA